MDDAEVRALRDAVERAFAAGRYQEALAQSIRLERAQPEEPSFARSTALVCQAMGRTLDMIDALGRAADRYASRGEVLKAAAVCKQILAADPENAETRARLGRLRAARPRPASASPPRPASASPPRPASAPARGPAPPRAGAKGPASAPWAGLQALPLHEMVPGARVASRAGVYSIPLADERTGPIPLSVLPSGVAAPQVVGGQVSDAMPAEDRAVLEVAEELAAFGRTERALMDSALFQGLPQDAFHSLIDAARLRSVPGGQVVFRQGDAGDALYVIAEGAVEVIEEGPPPRRLGVLEDGAFFGEMALIAEQPRSATCAAVFDCELIAIDRPVMAELLSAHASVLEPLLRFFRDRSVARLLRTSPLFSTLGPRDHDALRPHFRFLEAEPGADLLVEGSQPEGLLILLAGRAVAIRGGQRIGGLGPGEIAGEVSSLLGQPAGATVRAFDKVFAVELPAAAVARILDARPAARAYVEQVILRRGGR